MQTSSRSGRTRQALALVMLASLAGLALSVASSARLKRADFTFNNGAEVSTLDPATVSGVPEGRVVRALFEGLCVKDPRTLDPLPGMAESWEISEDRMTYTFHIRDGAVWTDGKPVTAYDFEYSWRRMLDPLTAAEYAYQLWYIRGAKQYSLMDDDLEYFAVEFFEGPDSEFWLKEVAPGKVRVGMSGFFLERMVRAKTLKLELDAGAAYQRGSPFSSLFSLDGERIETEFAMTLPFDASVLRVNPELEQEVDLILKDPCGSQWLAEVQVAPGVLQKLRDSGTLLKGRQYREEVVNKRLLGLHATDARTFVVELNSPTPFFLDICSFYPVFPISRANIESARARWPNEWELKWLRPENLVTNGPFRIEFRRVNDRIRLRKNETYWDAHNVAFDTVDVLAIDHLGTSLNLYLMGEIDWIDRPITNVIPRLMPREDFNPAAYLGSYFYRVNVTEPPFDDKRVRRALALSIDRRAIALNVTKAGEQIAYGFAPPGMGDYPMVEMAHATSGADYDANFASDIAEARALIAEAGFGPGGKDFPTFEIHYNTDQTHKDIAEVIADDWKKHLGLNVKLLNQEWKVYLDAQKSLDFDVTRSAWIGDYPDPNTFLDMFVTGGENNRTGWGNVRYDELIALAAQEGDEAKRTRQFAEAEAILLDELPILPIYYYVTRNLVNPRLGGFHANIQDEHFAKFWYWMSDEELAQKRAAQHADWTEVPARGPSAGQYAPAKR